MTQSLKSLKKPILRGYIHQAAFFMTVGAGSLLVAKSTQSLTLIASLIYVFGLLFLFGVSATYHIPYWDAKPRALMKRIDHSAIFIFIASTFTPICLLALPEGSGHQLLVIIWSAAVLGVTQAIFWPKAPRWLTAILYVIMGWLALPYIGELKQSLGTVKIIFIVTGGIVYTVGAVFYALKKPNLKVGFFGYHELFHLLTIIGAFLHFVVIYQLIR